MRKEDTVKLISSEGFEFVVDKKAAIVSQTIRNKMTSPEAQLGAVTLPVFLLVSSVCQRIVD